MNDLRPFLKKHTVFKDIQSEELALLMDCLQTRKFQQGEWIVHHGDIWPYLFMVASGQVTAVKESFEGRSLTLATVESGDIFWGLAFFIDQAPMPAALQATQDCELLLWAREDLLPLILENGRLSWELNNLVVQRVQFASEIVEKLAFQPVAGRLARLMVDLFGEETQGPISRNLTLDEMAARIGSTREMVCRFLHRFADDGLIDITRTEFSVVDRKRLEELAGKGKA